MGCFWRWFVMVLATIVWGFPLSVASSCLGYGYVIGWLVAVYAVLLGDLCCFFWWRSLQAREGNLGATPSAPRAEHVTP
jgi:uncharacterized membrane protein YdjX (TVP38/TMEM64 family)